MRLDSRLQKSRHGIYYLRIQSDGLDRRWSLRTRDPIQASIAAHGLSAKLLFMKKISTIIAATPESVAAFNEMKAQNAAYDFIEELEHKARIAEITQKLLAERPHLAQYAESITATPILSPAHIAPPTPASALKVTISLGDAVNEYIPVMYSLKTMSDKTKSEAETALNKMVNLLGADFNMWEFTNNRVRSSWMFKRKLEKSNRNLVVNDVVVMVDGKAVKKDVEWATVCKKGILA